MTLLYTLRRKYARQRHIFIHFSKLLCPHWILFLPWAEVDLNRFNAISRHRKIARQYYLTAWMNIEHTYHYMTYCVSHANWFASLKLIYEIDNNNNNWLVLRQMIVSFIHSMIKIDVTFYLYAVCIGLWDNTCQCAQQTAYNCIKTFDFAH